MKSQKIIFFCLLPVIIAAAFLAYSPSISGNYFADDFGFKFHDLNLNIKTVFSPIHVYAYRPLEVLFLAIMQKTYGENTIPIHFSFLLLNLLFSASIMLWMLKKGYSNYSSFLAFSIMALSQANSHAVSSLDTFSQISSTFLGYFSLSLFITYISGETYIRYYQYAGSFIILIIALLCKESAMSFIVIYSILVVIYIFKHCNHDNKKALSLLISLTPFILSLFVFMFLRKHFNLVPAEFGSERYNIGTGLNVFKNFLKAIFQSVQPHSSVDLYLNMKNNQLTTPIIASLFSIMIILITITGILKNKRYTISNAIILFLPISMFPTILLNHISELYVYNMVPLIAILIGIGIGTLYENLTNKLLKALILCFISIFSIWNAISVFSKSKLINQNGIEAEQILNKIQPYYSCIPHNGKLILINPEISDKTEYSIYKRTGFRLIEDGEVEIKRRSKRNDFDIIIKDHKILDSIDTQNSLILKYINKQIYEIKSPNYVSFN